ncbi:MAG: DUF2804 domain-containing protein [Bacillota bacterium]|nr:MAG: DUF2804 domain-containing protein [Bacillota bacterium]
MKQHQLSKGLLLDQHGCLNEAGYAFELVKTYDRKLVKVKGMRIKEWDYYFIGNSSYGVAFTVADNSYMWLTSLTFFDFIQKTEVTETNMGFFSLGKLNMPSSSEKGDVLFKKKNFSFEFKHEDGNRRLIVQSKKFGKHKGFTANILLNQTIKDSMVIATPFEKPKHFYYNQKINLLKASGFMTIGDKTYPLDDAYGVLDWGRGVWTYKNTWYWSSLSGEYQGKKIGFNLGYGFGDTSNATENMLFVDDQTYKLDDVTFHIPEKNHQEDYMSPWTITSHNLDINLTFTPILDRHSHSNILLISSNQHQVFGYFSGRISIGDKQYVDIKDMLGFAEKVKNRW